MKRIIVLLAFIFLFFVGTALASSGGSYGLDWFRAGESAGAMSGGTFTLAGTTGQSEAGALSGGSFSLSGGFVAGAGSSDSSGRNVYLPIVIK